MGLMAASTFLFAAVPASAKDGQSDKATNSAAKESAVDRGYDAWERKGFENGVQGISIGMRFQGYGRMSLLSNAV